MVKNNNSIFVIIVILILVILSIKSFNIGTFSTIGTSASCTNWLATEKSKGYIDSSATISSTNINWLKGGTTNQCISSIKTSTLNMNGCDITYTAGYCSGTVGCTDTCASLGYTSGTHTICGVSVECGTCTSHASFSCNFGNLYYYNSCGVIEDLKQSCPNGCFNSQCLSEEGATCDFVTNIEPKESRSSSYNSASAWISIDSNKDGILEKYGRYSSGSTTAIWTYEKIVENYNTYGDDIYFDGTYILIRSSSSYTKFKQDYGAAESAAITCDYSSIICSAGQTKCVGTTYYVCFNNNWVSQGLINGQCGYTTTPTCTTHSSSSCYLGDLYWYNSCEEVEDLKQECGTPGCSSGVCIQQSCNTIADTDCDSLINRAELGSYIIKWINNEVSRDELGNVIQQWINN